MALARVMLRPNRRMLLAVVGIVAAAALPMTTLVAADALEPQVESSTWVWFGDEPPIGAVRTQILANGDVVAWYDEPIKDSYPSRSGDAFESASLNDVSDLLQALAYVSLLPVALIMIHFMVLERQEHAHVERLLDRYGRKRLARGLVSLRGALTLATGILGGFLLTGLLMWLGVVAGDGLFSPGIGWLVLWQVLAGMVAVAVAWRMPRTPKEPTLPLPLTLRPVALGITWVPTLVLAALLVAVNVLVPASAAAVPGAVLASEDEWAFGLDDAGLGRGSTPLGPSLTAAFHPDIDAVSAEVLVPTLLKSEPVVLRGMNWGTSSAYHGLELHGDASGLVLGSSLAKRIGAAVGDTLPFLDGAGDVMEITVTGTATGNKVLAQEGFLPLYLAQEALGLSTNTIHVVRVQPNTDAARDAYTKTTPRISVLDVHVPDGEAGNIVRVDVELVNLGSQSGQRFLTARVANEPVAWSNVTVPGHAFSTWSFDYALPAGRFTLHVNPSQTLQTTGSAWTVDSPQFHGIAACLEGATGTISLEGPRELMVPIENGCINTPLEAGRWTLRHGETGAQVIVHDATTPPVLNAWIDPPVPAPGNIHTLHATLVRAGAEAWEPNIPLLMDGSPIRELHVELEPNSTEVMRTDFLWPESGETLRIGELSFSAFSQHVERLAPSERETPAQSHVVQQQAADRVLGNAEQVLGGVLAMGVASGIVLVALVTERTVLARKKSLTSLQRAAASHDRFLARVCWEAALIAASAMALVWTATVAGLGELLGDVVQFGHAPIVEPSFWAGFQAVTAFGAVAALVAYRVVGRILD